MRVSKISIYIYIYIVYLYIHMRIYIFIYLCVFLSSARNPFAAKGAQDMPCLKCNDMKCVFVCWKHVDRIFMCKAKKHAKARQHVREKRS